MSLLWSLENGLASLIYKDVAASAAGRRVCFYSPVSVVNMAYFKDTSITFFLRPTLLEREPFLLGVIRVIRG